MLAVYVNQFKREEGAELTLDNEGGYFDDGEVGDDITLTFSARNRKVTVTTTALTLPELEALRDSINCAIENSRPIVEERDKIAKEALASGDDSYRRSYRAAPMFNIRK
jgi:hypothetical protein